MTVLQGMFVACYLTGFALTWLMLKLVAAYEDLVIDNLSAFNTCLIWPIPIVRGLVSGMFDRFKDSE